MSEAVEISVVSPVYQAEDIVDELIERLRKALTLLTGKYEIILVEDCSLDNSWDKVIENCKKYKEVRGVKLSKNFGQQHAIQAGLDASKGKYVVTMDCDLQDPPEEIYKLIEKSKKGFEVVVASRKDRKDDSFKKFLSAIFYRVLAYLTETEQDHSVANFVVYHRKAVEALSQFNDHCRYYPMLLQLIGFNYAKEEIQHAQRQSGHSSYSFKKRLNLAVNTILTFSDKPLRLVVKAGALLSSFSIIMAFIMVIMYFSSNLKVEGWASLALLLSFFSGAIISVLGMVGLYVGRIFESVKNRPTYIIHKRIN